MASSAAWVGLYLVELKDGGTPIGTCGVLKRDELPRGRRLLAAARFWSQGWHWKPRGP